MEQVSSAVSYYFADKEELMQFIQDEIINTKEAMLILDCSRQNIANLIKRGKIVPIKEMPNDRLYLKSDILARVRPSQ